MVWYDTKIGVACRLHWCLWYGHRSTKCHVSPSAIAIQSWWLTTWTFEGYIGFPYLYDMGAHKGINCDCRFKACMDLEYFFSLVLWICGEYITSYGTLEHVHTFTTKRHTYTWTWKDCRMICWSVFAYKYGKQMFCKFFSFSCRCGPHTCDVCL